MSTKVTRLVCYLLFRLFLPIILLAGCALRYNILSFIYLIFLLVLPLIPPPSTTTVKGSTGLFLILIIVLSCLGVLAHIVFNVTVAVVTDRDNLTSYCSTNEKVARLVAVEWLDGVPFGHVLRLVILDVGVLATAILVFVFCFKVFKSSQSINEGDLPSIQPQIRSRKQKRIDSLLQFVGEFLVVLFLAACGIIVPSVFGAIYFLSFLYIATWWSFYKNLGKKFAFFRIFVLIWSGLHICILHLYQMQLFQEDWFPGKDTFVSRLLGLTAVIKTDCTKPWSVEFHDPSNWPLFVNPALILLLYFIVATETRYWKCKKTTDTVDGEDQTIRRKSDHRKRRKSTERQVLPQHEGQEESLVSAAEGTSYETFSNESKERPGGNPDSPTMSAAFESDEEDGGAEPRRSKKKKKAEVKRSAMASVMVYIMKQSYVLSLIAMMAWSITYHSWLTFVLLLSACFIWMVPQSRRACLLCSPLIMVYGECLLIIQFVYGMNLSELPETVNNIKLKEIGLEKFQYPCLHLALKILFTSMFWLTMRQFIRERKMKNYADRETVPLETMNEAESTTASWLNIPTKDQIDGYDSRTVAVVGSYVWNVLSKYWIFVCTAMLLVISLGDVVIYRIVYLFFFLAFMLAFQLSYRLWRGTMYLFWWVVIVYSMVILIILYTYQFSDFPSYWHNSTGLSDQVLRDIGLQQFDTATLFVKLLTPTTFLILIILQVHYFHKTFLKLSDLENVKSADVEPGILTTDTAGETTDSESIVLSKGFRRKVRSYATLVWNKSSDVWGIVSNNVWRILEVHFVKVVIFTILMVCVNEVSAIGAVFLIFLGVFMPITRGWTCLLHICRIWTAIAMIAKMIYQLGIIEKDYWNSNCTMNMNGQNTSEPTTTLSPNTTAVPNATTPVPLPTTTLYNPFANGTVNNAVWVGLDKAGEFAYYLRNYILIFAVLIFERIVFYRQKRRYVFSGLPSMPQGIIFTDTRRQNADKNLLSCAKFFANYFFYKYGLEICYIMFAVTICVRVDAYSVLYSIIFGILLLLSRPSTRRFWPVLTIFLAVLLPLQYLLCLGFPPGLCIEYPWNAETEMERDLETWLYLPNYFHPPHPLKLIADFFLLLLVCLQWQVFMIESNAQAVENYGGGSNSDILPEVEANTPIPVEDFTTVHLSYLDVLKSGFFFYMYWVTLFIIFLAGTTRINIFSIGYVIGVFWFMWYGQEFILKPLRKVRRSWRTFLGYTYLVIFLKAALQLLGCVYIDYLYDNQCWLVQLLGLTCISPSHTYSPAHIQPGSGNTKCVVEADDTGLSWDVVCLTFILIQLRVYNSHYFRHIIASAEAQNELASRGAQLINEILVTRVKEQREDEREVLENIKKKMDYLKSKQQKGVGKDFIEPDEHFQAIRSGDYYLFEEDKKPDPDVPTSVTLGTEEDEGTADPLKIITTAIESGPKAAVEEAEDEEKDSEAEQKESEEDKKDEPKEDTYFDKIKHILQLILKLLESLADWLTEKFNEISKNHRLVADKLEREMKEKKEEIRRNKATVTEQTLTVDISVEDGDIGPTGTSKDTAELIDVKLEEPGAEGDQGDEVDGALHGKPKQASKFDSNKSKLYLLLEATHYAILSRSEIVCYFLMILNQILYCSLLSLPLPLMVFLWGMLSVPRPSKTFWITVITYTEAMIVVKYIFQFGFFPWNDEGSVNTSPFWAPRIIGIEKKSFYVTADLVLLLGLFIHRSILKRYGLWKDADAISKDLSKAEEMISAPTTPVPEPDVDISKSLESSHSIQRIESSDSLEDSDTKKKEKSTPSLQLILSPFKNFYSQLTDPNYNATTDVYAIMFFCDFINFLILVFGYWAFGPEQSTGGDVTSYITEDRIPIPFLIMLVTQFILIVVDRALYLRKNILGKFIFQIFLVVLMHVWLFFILPYVTEREFSDNPPAQLFYFFKCVYFGFSAYQIRSSYPTRILGNFLTKKYNYVNLFLFKGFLAIPFLLELRVLMDWIWTDSTLAIGSWLQMEDIYANIYVLKCWREAERKYPTPRSIKKRALIKYGVGGLLLVLIIFIIWFPLVLFSFANTVYTTNPTVEVSASIAIGGYQPLFQVQAQQQNIKTFTAGQYQALLDYFNQNNKNALGTVNNYEAEDICLITLNGKSTSVWGISPPSRTELIQFLNRVQDGPAKIEFDVSFRRNQSSGDAGQTSSTQIFTTLDETTRKMLATVIEDEKAQEVDIIKLFPRFFRLSSKGLTILDFIDRSGVSLTLNSNNLTDWWNVEEKLGKGVLCPDPQSQSCSDTDPNLTIITLNDRIAPAGLSFLSGYGIIGLYVTFILLIGRILRLSTTGLAERITYNELPFVNNMLQLCLDIYLVREMHEFRLEEDLYAKLIFVYRSSETRIKWTRLPKDLIITNAKKTN